MSFNRMLTIGDVAKVFDGPHATPKKIDTGPYFLSISSLENGKLDLSKSAHLSDEDFAKWTRRVTPEAGDILFSYETRLGEVAMMPAGVTACLGRRMGLLRPDRSKILPEYLLYAYQSNAFQEVIRAKTIHGATVDRIALKELPSFPIQVPPLKEQRKIVDILKGYDRKLVLNLETNQTLEQMAQAIFKSWFVDFDPVKAKMNGEQPGGMDAATASLFPEKLVESELGLIPDGWEIKPIKDLCSKIQNGGTPKRSESSYWDGGDIPWLTSGEVRQSIITSVENRITQLGLDKSSAKWVPELSTLVALYGATAGEVSLTSIPLTTNQAVCALMPKKEHQWYNYLQLKSRVAELAGKAVGSAQQNISKGLVESTEVLSVPESLLEAFNAQVENLFKLRICNLQENVELAKLRDTLLPKLLSGEIELGESGAVDESDVASRLLQQMDFGVKSRPKQDPIPDGCIGYITTSGIFGSDGGTFVNIPKAVKALTKITSADGTYGELAGNALTENVLSGTVEVVTNNVIPLGVLTKICTAVFGKKTPIKPRNAVLLTSIHQAKSKTLDCIMNEQAKRFAFLEQPSMDEHEFGESLKYLKSIGLVKCEGQQIALLDTIVQH